jgi:predicted transposase YbfD/YdcC
VSAAPQASARTANSQSHRFTSRFTAVPSRPHPSPSRTAPQCFATEFDKPHGEGNYSYHATTDRNHGRVESRQYYAIPEPTGIRDEALWKDLQTIAMVVTERQVLGQAATSEIRYCIGSKPGKAKEYARYIRGHWGIENSLHWVLDVVFDKDRRRVNETRCFSVFGAIILEQSSAALKCGRAPPRHPHSTSRRLAREDAAPSRAKNPLWFSCRFRHYMSANN